MSDESEREKKPAHSWYSHPISILLLLIFATYGLLNGVMVWFSIETMPDLVSSQYYEDSKKFDQVLAARAGSDRLGWKTELLPPRPGDRRLRLRVVSAAGEPVTGLKGQAIIYRPSDAAQDRTLPWQENGARPGEYNADFNPQTSGLWVVTLDLRLAEQRLYETHRLVLP